MKTNTQPKLTAAMAHELDYLARGGSTIRPEVAPALKRRGYITNIEYHAGSGESLTASWPFADITDAGRAILKQHQEMSDAK